MDKENEIVCYILVRTDLNMPVGKVAAQVGHGVQYMILTMGSHTPEQAAWFQEWRHSSTKIVLGVSSLEEMNGIINKVDGTGYLIHPVTDEGRTCVEPNTLTVACMAPLPRAMAKPFVSHLRLLK